MINFVLRRILQAVPVVLAVALLIFVMFSVIPGSFVSSMGSDGRGGLDPLVVERLNEQLGLSDPLFVRFARYVGSLVQFDLGTSFRTREPVLTTIGNHAIPTLKLALAAMIFAAALGVPLGLIAALRPGSFLDMVSMIVAMSGISLPQFWLGLLMMYLFSLSLGWFPSFGYGDGSLKYLALPAITLGLAPMALLARTTRAAALDIMNADFMRTARSKGMSESRVVRWHLARNATVVILTTVGMQVGSIIGQAVVVEKLYAWPGIGSLLVDSVSLRDIPVVQGCILIIVLFFLFTNLLVDVVCTYVDPRIRYD